MLLIAEILLTFFAWRKGWRWYALLPMGASFIIGALIGIGIGASGGDPSEVTGLAIVLDLIATGVLIYMVAKSPNPKDPAGDIQ